MSENTQKCEYIKDEVLIEIRRRLKDTRFGYNKVDQPTYTKHVDALLADREALLADRATLSDQVAALARFKAWVHNYLDAKGIKTNPDGPHSKEGCRIGDRMDLVFAEIDTQLLKCSELEGKIAELQKQVDELTTLVRVED